MCLIKQIPLATNYIDTRHSILNAIVTFSQTITDSSQYVFTIYFYVSSNFTIFV